MFVKKSLKTCWTLESILHPCVHDVLAAELLSCRFKVMNADAQVLDPLFEYMQISKMITACTLDDHDKPPRQRALARPGSIWIGPERPVWT